jgi:hypothetical protein
MLSIPSTSFPGFSRLADEVKQAEIGATTPYYRCREAARNPRFAPYACGMRMWAGVKLGLSLGGPLLDRVTPPVASEGTAVEPDDT